MTEMVEFSNPRAMSEHFIMAMNDELDGLWHRGCFEEVNTECVDEHANVISSRFVLTLKHVRNPAEKCKARLVARGRKTLKNNVLFTTVQH